MELPARGEVTDYEGVKSKAWMLWQSVLELFGLFTQINKDLLGMCLAFV